MNIKRSVPYKIIKQILEIIEYKTKSNWAKLKYKNLENKILLATCQGSYTCNPKAICEELLKDNIPYELVWAIDKDEKNLEQFPKKLRLVEKGSKEFYKELVTSKILIENENIFGRRYCYKKRKGQIYIQTWHGSMGIKRMCVDRGLISRIMLKSTTKYQSNVDYIISNSKFETNLFRTTYWPNTNILEYGHARNDIFFKDNKELTKKIKKELNIPLDNKIFLYAPTFRENNSEIKELDFKAIKKTLEKKFKGTWTILLRYHHNDMRVRKNTDVIDVTKYPDMQELLIATDIGVTDYSSWICDYILSRKKGFLYVPDLKTYETKERGFYYPLTTMPFPVCETEEDLLKAIDTFDENKYSKKTEEYLNEMGCIEKGNAAKKIKDKIKEIINA